MVFNYKDKLMEEYENNIEERNLQLKNMIEYLMISLREENNITQKDICNFLNRTHTLSEHICKDLKK